MIDWIVADRIPPEKIEKIKKLRSEGWTILELSRELEVGKATVSRYMKDVKILPEFEELWKAKRNGSVIRKQNAEKKAYIKAEKTVAKLSDKERLLVISSLYWAEGAKMDSNLTNTDPDLIRIFVDCLRNIMKIPNNRLRLNVRIYEDMDEDKCVNYWLRVTGLSRENLSSVNVLTGKKNGKLEYGMCRVRILKGGDVLKYLVALKKRIIALF